MSKRCEIIHLIQTQLNSEVNSDDDGNIALGGKDDYDDQDNIQKVLIAIMIMVMILNTDFIP